MTIDLAAGSGGCFFSPLVNIIVSLACNQIPAPILPSSFPFTPCLRRCFSLPCQTLAVALEGVSAKHKDQFLFSVNCLVTVLPGNPTKLSLESENWEEVRKTVISAYTFRSSREIGTVLYFICHSSHLAAFHCDPLCRFTFCSHPPQYRIRAKNRARAVLRFRVQFISLVGKEFGGAHVTESLSKNLTCRDSSPPRKLRSSLRA